MKLELVPDQLTGYKSLRREKFERIDQNLSLLAVEAHKKNPWVGQYDRRKSVRNENASNDVIRATFTLKD